MTRISAGRFGGRKLITPAGVVTRPTSERVRAALGNALIALGGLEGARVLDLYAGSGALGLELLSRGADSAVFVEHDRAALAALRANVAALGVTTARIIPGDVADYVDSAGFAREPDAGFDLVVADPPYELDSQRLQQILFAVQQSGRLRPGADVVVERRARSGDLNWPDPLVGLRTKRYGDTVLCYGRAP